MMALRRQRREPEEGRWLEIDASMTGSLSFKDPVNLRINGRFEGTLHAKGRLAIGEQAAVRADITGESIVVRGEVFGNLTATDRIELASTARVTGRIAAPRLIVQEGAVLQGPVEMARGGSPWMSVEELATYLEVDPQTVLEWAEGGRLPGDRHDGGWRFDRAKIEEWLAHEKIK
jgi:excisionase family DNA binding protein